MRYLLFFVPIATAIHSFTHLNDSSLRMPKCPTESINGLSVKTYPDSLTATSNGTVAILPMSLDYIENRFNRTVLRSAILDLLPDFPRNMYPAIANIQELSWFQGKFQGRVVNTDAPGSLAIPDGKVISVDFPFLDHLLDGSTPFRHRATLLVSTVPSTPWPPLPFSLPDQTLLPADVTPHCGAYADDTAALAHILAAVTPVSPSMTAAAPLFRAAFAHRPLQAPRPPNVQPFAADMLRFVANVTNQPAFGHDGRWCDVSEHVYGPPPVLEMPDGPRVAVGNVSAMARMVCDEAEKQECDVGRVRTRRGACREGEESQPCGDMKRWEDVYGMKGAHLVVFHDPVSCDELHGYPEKPYDESPTA